ncbi:hypothetical protein HOU03_gp217 [Caulobacter phage CcrSC]|uniref:Uncharacterized protein n=1 Tax=Caulobacter phage CcrSC TaxID=2283272 RepID=A0A385EDU9_9CAUD|nr:hypothetical protein HOU03_gp217 [Caulobacter phage CcrSC]AXQ70051.1 hypothetical protein CcrSC_gp469 [Caulobacter phage CcrSC]
MKTFRTNRIRLGQFRIRDRSNQRAKTAIMGAVIEAQGKPRKRAAMLEAENHAKRYRAPRDLGEVLPKHGPPAPEPPPPEKNWRSKPRPRYDIDHLVSVYLDHRRSLARAARALEMHPSTLQANLKRHRPEVLLPKGQRYDHDAALEWLQAGGQIEDVAAAFAVTPTMIEAMLKARAPDLLPTKREVDEDAVRAAYLVSDLDFGDFAKQQGLTPHRARRITKGLKRPYRRHKAYTISARDVAILAKFDQEGLSTRTLAKVFGVSAQRISQILLKHGRSPSHHKQQNQFAERHARKEAKAKARAAQKAAFKAKRDADGFRRYDIAKARALYLEGLSQTEVARRVGVHPVTIHLMVHRDFPEIVAERARLRKKA